MTNYGTAQRVYLAIKVAWYLVFTAIFISSITPCSSQSKVYLQHRHKSNCQRKISPNKAYNISTVDTTFYRYHIIDFSDSTLKIVLDSGTEIIDIPVSDIEHLEKVKKYGFFEVVGTLGVVGLTITPIIWATEGGEEALGLLEASGVLLASSFPIILLKDIGRKKDMRKKWKLSRG